MPDLTANFSFNLPKVNNAEDEDLWGSQLNTNWSSTDGLLPQDTSLQTAANFSVSATADFNKQYIIDTTSNNVTADLPAMADVIDGYVVHFRVVDTTNTFTIDPSGAEVIDGAASFTTATAVSIQADKASATDQWRTFSDVTDVAKIPAATETVSGILETATDTEAKAQSATDKIIVPSNLAAINASVAECAAGTITDEFMSPGNFAGSKSLAADGFYTFPGGFTVQWGLSGAVPASGTLVVSYPTAFTTAYSTVLTGIVAAVNDNPHLDSAITNTQFTIRGGGSGASGCYWIATGII